MEKINSAFQLMFYLVWIPLGILFFGVTLYLVFTNPLEQYMQQMKPKGPSEGIMNQQGGQMPQQEEMQKQNNPQQQAIPQ